MRFVNVDDFKKEIMECNTDPINEFDLGWDTWGIFNAIDRTPTADVQPVIHSYWIDEELYDHNVDKYINIKTCANCKNHNFRSWDYCPDCGAKMDKAGD